MRIRCERAALSQSACSGQMLPALRVSRNKPLFFLPERSGDAQLFFCTRRRHLERPRSRLEASRAGQDFNLSIFDWSLALAGRRAQQRVRCGQVQAALRMNRDGSERDNAPILQQHARVPRLHYHMKRGWFLTFFTKALELSQRAKREDQVSGLGDREGGITSRWRRKHSRTLAPEHFESHPPSALHGQPVPLLRVTSDVRGEALYLTIVSKLSSARCFSSRVLVGERVVSAHGCSALSVPRRQVCENCTTRLAQLLPCR